MLETFLPIIFKDIPHFVNFILGYVRLCRLSVSHLHITKGYRKVSGKRFGVF